MVLDAHAEPVATSAYHQAMWFPGDPGTDAIVTHTAAGVIIRQDTTSWGNVSRFRSDIGGTYGGFSTSFQVLSGSSSNQVVQSSVFGNGTLPCGSDTSVEGDQLVLGGSCAAWPTGDSGMVTLLRAGSELVTGKTAQRFEGENITAWMIDRLPTPARIENERVRLELVGLRELTPEAATVPEVPAPTAWSTSKILPWGLDETGIDTPFSARDAYEAAKVHPSHVPLSAFLLLHPDAVPFVVEGTTTKSGERTFRYWHFVLADADALWEGHVTQETSQGLEIVTVTTGLPIDRDARRLPSMALLPEYVPTLQALDERWSTRTSTGVPEPNTWGYSFDCADADCNAATYSFHVGHEVWEFPPHHLEQTTQEARGIVRRAVFDQDGAAIGFSASDYRTARTPFARLGHDPGSVQAATSAPRLLGFEASTIQVWAGFAAASGLVAVLWRAAPFLVALYARIHRGALPEHPTRSAIIDLVEQNPGIRYSDLLRSLGCSKGTLEHHLRLLENGGHIVLVKRNGLACYFRTAQLAALDAQAWLRSTTARRIVGLLAEKPVATGDVHRWVGCSRSNAHRHLAQIEKAGLVRREGRVATITEAGLRAWRIVRTVPRAT